MLLSAISRCIDYFIKALVLYGIVENIYYIIRMLDNAFSSRYRVDLIFFIKRASLSSCDLIIHWDWYCSRYDNDRKWKGRKEKGQGGCWIAHFSNYDFVINDPHDEVEIEVTRYFIFSSVNDGYLSLPVSKRTINRHLMGACKLQGKISNKNNYTYYW